MNFVVVRRSCRFPLLVFAAVVLAAVVQAARPSRSQDPAASSPLTIDVLALDREGRLVEDLRPADFLAAVNGVPRRVLWVRRVSRGPGAVAEASARQSQSEPGLEFSAETRRTVLVVIDQASIARGQERDAIRAAGSFLDRLGLDDHVAVLRLPLLSNTAVTLTTERPEARAALARVRGEMAPGLAGAAAVPAAPSPDPGISADEARMTGIDIERRIDVDPTAAPPLPGSAQGDGPVRETLDALRAVLDGLGRLPGRKVVALFSAGLPASSTRLVDDTARAAAAARAVVYSFGLKATGVEGALLTTSPLERLAAATGGTFSSLARNPERALERAAAELGACYVLGVEGRPGDAAVGRRAARVETTRKGLAIRAGSWFPANPDSGDEVVAPASPVAPGVRDIVAPPLAPAPTARPARDANLQLALARLFEYADGYERQYSMLVAEEDFRQSAPGGRVRLRSDLLLVRPEQGDEWVSFRDVYEVDGNPVRDREDRIRRLFLEATPDAMARLKAISQESARYNVGAVERTVNVPLLPFSFLRRENRGRFDYELAERDEVDGLQVWRIRYTERARPTVVQDLDHLDVPVSGWLLVDVTTGAVIETRMNARRGDARAEIAVRYRRDSSLGLWVPAEMKESYSLPQMGAVNRFGMANRINVEGHATYSNFRRFQVTTEEKITPPK